MTAARKAAPVLSRGVAHRRPRGAVRAVAGAGGRRHPSGPGRPGAARATPRSGWSDNIDLAVRVPRTALGLTAGAALGLSGALMQGLTRNPLADPGILGVNAGRVASASCIADRRVRDRPRCSATSGSPSPARSVASVVVYLLGRLGRGGPDAGQARAGRGRRHAPAVLAHQRHRAASTPTPSTGSASGRSARWPDRTATVLAGRCRSWSSAACWRWPCAPALNSLALGDDVAAALGRRLGLVRLRASSAVMLLDRRGGRGLRPDRLRRPGDPARGPDLAQSRLGPDHRWLLPLSVVLAPMPAARRRHRRPGRSPGPARCRSGSSSPSSAAPFFIALVRRRRLAELWDRCPCSR